VKKSYTFKSVFQKLVFKGGLYSRKRHIEKKVVFVREIYFEKKNCRIMMKKNVLWIYDII
jgi:hypothetical protein